MDGGNKEDDENYDGPPRSDAKRVRLEDNAVGSNDDILEGSSSGMSSNTTGSTSNSSSTNEVEATFGNDDASVSELGSFVHHSTSYSLTVDMDDLSRFEENDSQTSNDSRVEAMSKLIKKKVKNNWFTVPEMINRQFGFNYNKRSPSLFQNRFYSSMQCTRRLKLLGKLNEHRGCVNSLNFHHNGSLLASGSDDLNVIIWDWKLSKSILSFNSKHRSNIFQSKFLPINNDLYVVTCARDGQVRLSLVSAQDGLRSNRKLGCHTRPCHKLATLKSQPYLVLSAGEDGYVYSFDIRDPVQNEVVKLRSNGDVVALYSISANPLNNYEFCVSGCSNKVFSYDQRKCSNKTPLNTYFAPIETPSFEDTITCCMYSYNGSEIAASYNCGDIFVFDVNNTPGSFAHKYTGHRNEMTIKGVNFFGPKSEFVISGSDCGNIFIWDKESECIVNYLHGDECGVVNCLEPHPEFPVLCTSGLDFDIKVWMPTLEKDNDMSGLEAQLKMNQQMRSDPLSAPGDGNLFLLIWNHIVNTEGTSSEDSNLVNHIHDFLQARNGEAMHDDYDDSSSSNELLSSGDEDSSVESEPRGPSSCMPS